MKILVTGASGYIGRHVVIKLLDLGHEVIASSRNPEAVDNRAIRIKADILSWREGDWYTYFKKPDACIHLAWRDGFVHNSPTHMEDLSKHTIFLESLISGGIKKLSVMGTMHEVGYYEGAIDEKTPCNPKSLYGIAKDTLRRRLEAIVKDKSCTLQWLRAFYIYGDDIYNSSIFTKLLQAEKNGDSVFPFTQGKNRYDFINVEQLAAQIAACILYDEDGGIINCCSGVPVCLSDMAESFIENNKLSITLLYGAFPEREYDSPGIWGNAERITKILQRAYGGGQ